MAERQQAWVGIALGSFGLLALFGVLYALSGRSGVALDGDQVETATAGDSAAAEGADVLGDVTTSGADGQVRSFGSDESGSIDGGDPSGFALRVVTDERSTGSSTASTASPSNPASQTPSTTAAGLSSNSSNSSTAATAPTTKAPTTATTATTNAPTGAEQTATTERQTTTTKASPSSSSPTSSTTTATTAAPTTQPPTTGSGSSSNARTFEQEVIRLTNEERSDGGCRPLTNNGKLHAAALGHSVDMADNNYFSHTSQDGSSMVDRVERQGYGWRSLAENIAAGYRSPASVVDGWMNSSGHRANILNCSLTEIGVGFHNYHWTQNFGAPR